MQELLSRRTKGCSQNYPLVAWQVLLDSNWPLPWWKKGGAILVPQILQGSCLTGWVTCWEQKHTCHGDFWGQPFPAWGGGLLRVVRQWWSSPLPCPPIRGAPAGPGGWSVKPSQSGLSGASQAFCITCCLGGGASHERCGRGLKAGRFCVPKELPLSPAASCPGSTRGRGQDLSLACPLVAKALVRLGGLFLLLARGKAPSEGGEERAACLAGWLRQPLLARESQRCWGWVHYPVGGGVWGRVSWGGGLVPIAPLAPGARSGGSFPLPNLSFSSCFPLFSWVASALAGRGTW